MSSKGLLKGFLTYSNGCSIIKMLNTHRLEGRLITVESFLFMEDNAHRLSRNGLFVGPLFLG